MTPGNAALLSLLLPGLGHVLLGRAARGFVFMAVAVGMFWAGYSMVGDRLFFCALVDPSPDGMIGRIVRFAPINVLPECLNFGCTAVASVLREVGSFEASRLERLPRDGEHLALLLTGLSGVLSAIVASEAHWLARGKGLDAGRVAPATAAAATWLLPGFGHVLAGQKSKGMLMGGAVFGVFALGMLLSAGHGVDRPALPAWWIGNALIVPTAALGALVTGPMQFDEYPTYLDFGFALCTVSGIMNMIVMVNAYSVAEDAIVDGVTDAPASGAPGTTVEGGADA